MDTAGDEPFAESTMADRESGGPREKILLALAAEIEQNPPTIAVIGVSGVGKSSTINALFRTDLPTSDTVACTREFRAVDLAVRFQAEQASAATPAPKVRLRVVDAPGLGEDLHADPGYLDQYRDNLGRCDAILWVMAARNRAIALDQRYLGELAEYQDKMVFGINQVDLVEPMDWRVSPFNLPSAAQQANLESIVDDRAARIGRVIGRPPVVIGYSSRRGYRLEHLFAAILDSCPPQRRWIYAGLRNFSYLDFIPVQDQRKLLFRAVHGLARMLGSSTKTGRTK